MKMERKGKDPSKTYKGKNVLAKKKKTETIFIEWELKGKKCEKNILSDKHFNPNEMRSKGAIERNERTIFGWMINN